jgi:hypothetical protein
MVPMTISIILHLARIHLMMKTAIKTASRVTKEAALIID